MAETFSYSELSTRNLKWLANLEAEQFELPSNWREGRTLRQGYTIDEPYSRDIDDAIAYEDGVLRVSIADIGSFAVNLPAVTEYAQRVTASRYQGNQISYSMLPSALSERKLSLLDQQERPGITFHIPISEEGEPGELTITKDIIHATSISAAEVDTIPYDKKSEESHTPFHDLREVAIKLYLRRHPGRTLTMEDYEGRIQASAQFSIGRFVVKECMVLARVMAGQYIADHDIPAIYTRHDIPTALKQQLGELSGTRLEQTMAKVSLTQIHNSRHAGLNARNVVSITSPLREFTAYVNQSNLVAHLDGREPLLGREALGYVVSRYNRVRHNTSPFPEGKRKNILYTSEIRQRIEADALAPAEISQLFFGLVIGEEEEIVALRQEVFGMLLSRGAEARSAIEIAVQRKLVETVTENGQTFLVDRTGKQTPYANLKRKSRTAIASNALAALSERAGIPMSEAELTAMLNRAAILKDARTYLEGVSLKAHSPFTETVTVNEETGEHICTISMRIRGGKEMRTASSTDPDEAMRLAYNLFITDLDLIDNPPVWIKTEQANNWHVLQELKGWITKTPKADPRHALQTYAQINSLKAVPEYTIDRNEEGRPRATCTLRIIQEQTAEDGTITEVELHASTAIANNKVDARLLASEKLATQLNLPRPARPKPQSKKRK